jgi:hypothetical protein
MAIDRILRTNLLVAGVLALSTLSAGCGASSPARHTRFHNQNPIWVVNDRKDVKKEPAERKFYKALYHFDGIWHGRIDRWMEMRRTQRAQSVNSLDEVPDSTWFTNRIGVRDLGVEEIRTGPNMTGSPEDHRPWIIKSSKVGGVNVGFIIVDQRGVKYVLKFDEGNTPEMETGADVVLQRLLWACGFNVPEDYIVQFRREDLVRAPDAAIKDPMGEETPMSDEFIDMQLAKIIKNKDGSIRGLASQFIPGTPIGGYARDGVREDDPNDTIPHQLRRETRGLYAINSWLDHTDMKEDNTLDTYVEDPRDPEVHYVLHYLIDFGKGLGTQGYLNQRRWVGFSYIVDLAQIAASSVTLGLWKRPWEGRLMANIPGVGIFESELYDPGHWKSYTPSYFPFHDVDRFDGFWGAKIVVRFTRDQIRAAVEAGRFSDRRAVEYLTGTLVERQRKTARYWFDRVNPLDRFQARPNERGLQLCFEDLAIRYAIDRAPTRYAARAFDYEGNALAWTGKATPGENGRACLEAIRPAASHEGYTVIEIVTHRQGANLPPTLVHLGNDKRSGQSRVIGLRRL